MPVQSWIVSLMAIQLCRRLPVAAITRYDRRNTLEEPGLIALPDNISAGLFPFGATLPERVIGVVVEIDKAGGDEAIPGADCSD